MDTGKGKRQQPFVSHVSKSKISESESSAIFQKLKETKPEEWNTVLLPIKDRLVDFQNICRSTEQFSDVKSLKPDVHTWQALPNDVQRDFKVVKVAGDGDCFYSSVSVCLFGTEQYKNELRLLSVLHYLEMKSEERAVAEKVFSKDFSKILKRTTQNSSTMTKDSGWAEEPQIYAMSCVIGRPISSYHFTDIGGHFWLFDFQRQISQTERTSSTPIYIMLRGDHFQPLLTKTEEPEEVCD